MGDIVYALPTIAALGPGSLSIGMDEDRYQFIAPLLRTQSCLTGVERFAAGSLDEWERAPEGTTHNLNRMRHLDYTPLNDRLLTESHAVPFGARIEPGPWLEPNALWKREENDRCVVARSFKYRRDNIKWDRHISALKSEFEDVVFVGLESEYRDFGHGLDWIWTPDALDLAQVIYESRYFAGNQSLPLAIAAGFGIRHAIEEAPGHKNCTRQETHVLS
jgi:hypothetical protein